MSFSVSPLGHGPELLRSKRIPRETTRRKSRYETLHA